MRRFFLYLLACMALPLVLSAQNDESLPTAFTIGTYEDAYEEIVSDYQQSFLEVCNNDLQEGAELWLSVLREMEAYADQIGYDLEGVRVWFHVFFNQNGSIEHIGYYLKPNSRHVEEEGMLAFLSGFAGQYQLPRTSDQPFTNYSAASFPVYYNLMRLEEEN